MAMVDDQQQQLERLRNSVDNALANMMNTPSVEPRQSNKMPRMHRDNSSGFDSDSSSSINEIVDEPPIVASNTISTRLAKSAGLPDNRYPETLEEADVVDRILSEAISNLSLDEQEKILFDIHGMSSTPYQEEEDPVLLQAKLHQMEAELLRLPDNEPYLEACKINEAYVDRYRRIYLLAQQFKVKAAAAMTLHYFTVKKELFGGGPILGRDIRQSDLRPKALRMLETGMMQTSTVRDSAGRTVFFMSSQYDREGAVLEDIFEAVFYYGMTTLQDVETLRSGAVWVFYNLDGMRIEKEAMDPIYRVEKCLPPRIVGCHYCFMDKELLPVVTGMQLFLSDDDRVRTKPHFGSLEEIHFKLQTYGIPVEAGLVKKDGTANLAWLDIWLRSQKSREDREAALESTTRDSESIVVPRRFDVIIGKTSQARIHTGNRRAIHLCDMHFEEYEQSSKFMKTEVAEKVVSIIRQSGGRFLKWEDDEGWVEETDGLVARKKISHFFRYMRSKVVKNKEAQTCGSKRTMKGGGEEDPAQSTVVRVTPPASPRSEP